MNNVDAVISSFRESLKLKKIIGFIYMIQLLLAAIVGIAASRFIDQISHTVSIKRLLLDFDYKIIEDLKNAAPVSWSSIGKAAVLVSIIYLIISLFLHSGLLYCIYHRRYRFKDFTRGVKSYFKRFLSVSLFFMFLTIVWTVLIWIPFVTNLFYMIEHWVAEYMIVWLIPILGVIYFAGIAFLFSWSVQTRYYMIYQSYWSLSAFRKGLNQVKSTRKDHCIQLLLFASILVLLYGLSIGIDATIGVSSALLVILFLIIQQVWVLLKLWHRVSVYISLRNLQRIRRDG